jgi:hypothetical protein
VNVVAAAPSHSNRYCENPPSAYLMSTLYAMSSDPLSNGAVQVIKSLGPMTLVNGFTGVKGFQAQRDEKTAESRLSPKTLVDVTTK